MVAKIAVSAAVYAIDKPYSYKIPQSVTVLPGQRVKIPFGRGNRRCEGIVLELCEQSEEKLKTIETVLDETPVLNEKQLRMAAFLRERCFCTFYDAARAILPVGFWFRLRENYSVIREAPDWRIVTKKNEAAAAVMQTLEDFGGSADLQTLRGQFPDEQTLQSAIRYLMARKLIAANVDMAQRSSEKTEKMAQLLVSCEEAESYAAKKQKSAPLQKSVLELLCMAGSASCREICYLTGATMQTLRRLEKLELICVFEREIFRSSFHEELPQAQKPVLSAEQQTAFDGILSQMNAEKPGVGLLYGVTGSGKTAVYLRLIYAAREKGRSAILLVPEIALTPQLLAKLRSHFGRDVAVLHSSLQMGERYDEWRRIREGRANVVVGTRSAIFAPVREPGIIIVDEEQEHTYKSENSPRYHAREVAIYRGSQENCMVLLGSATPSVESMYRAQSGAYSLYTLRERYNGRALPQVCMTDMKQELLAGNDRSISRQLEESIRDTILSGHQAILFLNRRGNSRYLVCTDCGEAPSCPRCSVHLTYHSVNQRLLCHYCGYSQPAPEKCPTCGGHLKPVGFGTQKVQQELAELFPDTEVLRMDADTVSASNNHEAIFSRFVKEKIPILLGTQMVAKGLDFENVTLVGVLDADLSLYVNSFRAAETTFSLLTQVVGRAGRGQSSGMALVQTMSPEHPVLQLAAGQNYDAFYDMEIRLRTLRNFPPLRDMFTVTLTSLFEDALLRSAMTLRRAIEQNLASMGLTEASELLGPVQAPVAKINYTYRYRITLCCKNTRPLRNMLSFVLREFAKDSRNKGVTAFADTNAFE